MLNLLLVRVCSFCFFNNTNPLNSTSSEADKSQKNFEDCKPAYRRYVLVSCALFLKLFSGGDARRSRRSTQGQGGQLAHLEAAGRTAFAVQGKKKRKEREAEAVDEDTVINPMAPAAKPPRKVCLIIHSLLFFCRFFLIFSL